MLFLTNLFQLIVSVFRAASALLQSWFYPQEAARRRLETCIPNARMSVTSFSFPAPTLFGVGALAELPLRSQALGIRRPLVVTDAGLVATAAFGSLTETLGGAERGKDWFLYSGVHPNP